MQKRHERKELVVSIHDVSPLTRERTDAILRDLALAGVDKTSLLVIPDHHHRGNIAHDSGFADWLSTACSAGHEAVLHGYYHLRPARNDDGPWKRAITRSYTAGEGEFFDLEKAAARRLLEQGLRDLAACGISPSGFIAPAWLLGPEAEEAVREAGFQYTTRISTVKDFLARRAHRSRSQVWSVRAAWRRACSLAWNHLLFRATSATRLARIGIHPPDWDHPAIRRQILELAGKALAGREPMTYDGWLNRLRSSS